MQNGGTYGWARRSRGRSRPGTDCAVRCWRMTRGSVRSERSEQGGGGCGGRLTPERRIHSIDSPCLRGRGTCVTSPVRPSGSAVCQRVSSTRPGGGTLRVKVAGGDDVVDGICLAHPVPSISAAQPPGGTTHHDFCESGITTRTSHPSCLSSAFANE